MLLTTQGCARLRTGPIIMQIPRGYQKKRLLCRKVRYVRSLGKKPHFWPSQRLNKVLLAAQGCARLRTGPIIMQIPRGIRKKSLLCRKARYVQSLGKKPNFWPSQRLKKLTGALSCMHKSPKCIPSLWDHLKKISIVQKHKESVICAILKEKTPFWGLPRA